MKNVIELWNINTSSKIQSRNQRKLDRFVFFVQNMDFNLPILGIPLECRLMNGLNVFSMCLSGCHTECSIECKEKCARGTDWSHSRTQREIQSSELTCFWVGRSSESQFCNMSKWNELYATIVLQCMQCAGTHARTHSQYMNKSTAHSEFQCVYYYKECLVSVTSDYVSNHSIHCNLTTEVLNWEM